MFDNPAVISATKKLIEDVNTLQDKMSAYYLGETAGKEKGAKEGFEKGLIEGKKQEKEEQENKEQQKKIEKNRNHNQALGLILAHIPFSIALYFVPSNSDWRYLLGILLIGLGVWLCFKVLTVYETKTVILFSIAWTCLALFLGLKLLTFDDLLKKANQATDKALGIEKKDTIRIRDTLIKRDTIYKSSNQNNRITIKPPTLPQTK